MTRSIVLAALLAAPVPALAAEAAPADAGPRNTLIVNGLFGPLANEFEETRGINMFSEAGTIESDYEAKGGAGIDVGFERRITPRLAIVASFVYASRSTDDDYVARLPHPLYLDQHRVVEGTLDGLTYSETASHLSVAYVGNRGKIGYSLFAGPSLFAVTTELVERATTTEAYPYDTVTPHLDTETHTKSVRGDDLVTGAHAGASLGYAVGRRIALGLQARYGIGTASFEANDDAVTKVKLGGLQIGLGLRFAF